MTRTQHSSQDTKPEKAKLFRGKRRLLTFILGASALSVLLLTGCSHHQVEANADDQAANTSSADSHAQLFSIPQEQMSHIKVETVEPSSMHHVLRLPGTVAYNAFETTPVLSQISGPISRVLIVPGQHVTAGQPMLYVTSPDFAQLRTTYLKAKDAVELAQKAFVRAQDLFQHHAIAQADLEQAESTEDQAEADLQSSQQALRVVGVNHPEQISRETIMPEVPVFAPISGEAVERLVSPGQVIQAGATQVFTISNMSKVWVLASVYERDMGSVHNGEAATIQADAYPDEFHGVISYTGAALDPTSHTLQVRIVTDNPGEKLKKDMYVTATIQAGATRNVLTVPDSAVLRDAQNEPFVYVESGSNQYGQRQIVIGESGGGQTQVQSGLKAGDRVIADGSLFLQFQNSFQH